MTVSRLEYETLVADRPQKFDEDQVNYRPANRSQFRCDRCLHYFTRITDNFGVCEIFRPTRYARRRSPEEGYPTEEIEEVQPEMVCDFFSADGSQYPLLSS